MRTRRVRSLLTKHKERREHECGIYDVWAELPLATNWLAMFVLYAVHKYNIEWCRNRINWKMYQSLSIQHAAFYQTTKLQWNGTLTCTPNKKKKCRFIFKVYYSFVFVLNLLYRYEISNEMWRVNFFRLVIKGQTYINLYGINLKRTARCVRIRHISLMSISTYSYIIVIGE